MSAMLALAEKLDKDSDRNISILLLFQHAEENGQGASAIIKSGFLRQFNISHVFALHNTPGFEQGSIIIRQGAFSAAVETLIISLEGKTAHAAEPEKGINPANAVAEIINAFQNHHSNGSDINAFFKITPVYINMGQNSFGTAAGMATLVFTCRAYNNRLFSDKKQQLELLVKKITANTAGLKVSMAWTEPFKASINDTDAVRIVKGTAEKNDFPLIVKETPFPWGEDFGVFCEQYKGAMFALGIGSDCPPLHHPEYRFPEDLIYRAAHFWLQLIKEISIE